MVRHSLTFFVVAGLVACGPQGTLNRHVGTGQVRLSADGRALLFGTFGP